MLKMTIRVFRYIEVHGSKENLPSSSSDLNLVTSYSAELCNKSCIIKTSETLIIWSAFCYDAESDPGHNKRDARLTAEE